MSSGRVEDNSIYCPHNSWNALQDLDVDEAWIIAPVKEGYPFADNVWVKTLPEIMHQTS